MQGLECHRFLESFYIHRLDVIFRTHKSFFSYILEEILDILLEKKFCKP